MRKGTNAIRNKIQMNFFSQCFRRICSQPITPVMPNKGSQAPSDDHLELESGVKLGRAGRSGGKKKQVRMWRYRCTWL